MTPSSQVLRVASASASAAVLAIAVGLFPGGPAAADSAEPTPATTTASTQAPSECQLLCLPVLGEDTTRPETERPRKVKEPAGPPAQPADPAQAEQPAPPAAPPAVTVPVPAAPSPAPSPDETGPAGEVPEDATASAVPTPSNGPTGASNWNTPVTRSAKATQVAAVSPADSRDPGGPELLPVAGGVLLVGVATAAFTWWGRNRVGGH
ncbi:hypothetical protein [Arthrobacter sp. D3-16]